MIDPTVALNICRAYKLTLEVLQMIQEARDLLSCKIPGLTSKKDLYRCYTRFGKEIWSAAEQAAEEQISLPDPHEHQRRYGSSKNLPPRPKANALHFIAGLNGADKIRQLADIGSLLAQWYIEDMSWFVVEDYNENQEDPQHASYAAIWAPLGAEEEMHMTGGWNEALVKKLNRLLEP